MKPLVTGWRMALHLVFPRIRAGASLKLVGCDLWAARGVVFPRIRAGASLKPLHVGHDVDARWQFSPAFVRGPH